MVISCLLGQSIRRFHNCDLVIPTYMDRSQYLEETSSAVARLHRTPFSHDLLLDLSVIVGEKASIFGKKRANRDDDDDDDDDDEDDDLNVDGAAVFSSPWLPSGDNKAKNLEEDEKDKKEKKRQKQKGNGKKAAGDEDVVEDFILSSDEEESSDEEVPIETEDVKKKAVPSKHVRHKRNRTEKSSKGKGNINAKNKSKKRKMAH